MLHLVFRGNIGVFLGVETEGTLFVAFTGEEIIDRDWSDHFGNATLPMDQINRYARKSSARGCHGPSPREVKKI